MGTFFLYRDRTPAKFTFAGRALVLTNGVGYELVRLEGKWFVVKDGFRYPINPTYLKELARRSEKVTPEKSETQAVKFFDKFGHTALKYVQARAKDLTKGTVESGFTRGEAYAKWSHRLPTSEVMCALRLSKGTVMCAIYSSAPLKVSTVGYYAEMQRAVGKIAKRLVDTHHFQVGRFESRSAKLANLTMPWGVFSGYIYYYIAKWHA